MRPIRSRSARASSAWADSRRSRELDRAATSIVLNIAEGAGEFSPADKQRFYRMARRSATESAAILDILGRRKAIAEDVLSPARELIVRVVSMLARLASR